MSARPWTPPTPDRPPQAQLSIVTPSSAEAMPPSGSSAAMSLSICDANVKACFWLVHVGLKFVQTRTSLRNLRDSPKCKVFLALAFRRC